MWFHFHPFLELDTTYKSLVVSYRWISSSTTRTISHNIGKHTHILMALSSFKETLARVMRKHSKLICADLEDSKAVFRPTFLMS